MTFIVSFPSLAVSIGTILGPVVGGVVYQKFGYEAVFQLSLAILGVDVLLRLLMKETKSTQRMKEDKEILAAKPVGGEPRREYSASPLRFAKMLKNPRVINSLMQSLVVAWQLTALDATMTIRLMKLFGFNSLQSGLMFLPMAIPAFLEPLIGYLCDRHGPRYFLTFGFLFSTVPLMLLQLPNNNSAHDVVIFVTMLALYGITSVMIFSPILSELSDTVSQEESKAPGQFGKGKGYGQIYGLFNMAYSLGSLAGPIQAGYTVERYSWGVLMITLAVMSLLMVPSSFYFASRGVRPPRSLYTVADITPTLQEKQLIEEIEIEIEIE
ncbi:membrane transporter [Sugiyamaella lignohabitans]|uniref:Membrane transporter n=1 Tax=Sugiyamaella lignohabitans TaxID=796027 RepID=A0A167DFD3_9ASCO|nr:membrane transporter [Sugiyamaella lignohabitans]ANB12854.1 membrane transporter [Sugiyamaella lignohabitans]